MIKLFQFDDKSLPDETEFTLQFGIIKDRTLVWVNYENPTRMHYSSGGFHILFSLFTSSSLLGVDLLFTTFSISCHFFTDYIEDNSIDT
jgi:hypothetical protein